MNRKLKYVDFITNAEDKNSVANIQWFLESGRYSLFLFDSDLVLVTQIDQDSTQGQDFETNYKQVKNMPLEPKDADGSKLTRGKVAPLGWLYQLHGVDFTTAKLNSAFNQDELGNDLGFATVELYDAQDILITEEVNEGNAVKTVINWEPTHTFEIIGGDYLQGEKPTQDVRLWVIAVPDVPKEYGGDKDFIQGGINLKHIMCSLEADGRVAKKLSYIEGMKLTKMEITLKHPAGYQHSGQMLFEIFKGQ